MMDWHQRYLEWWKKKLNISDYGVVWISFFKGIWIVAKKVGVSDIVRGGGYRSLVNVGENAGQEVPHLHFHIFGG